MSIIFWILLILSIIIIATFGYFYYQGITYVAPKIVSSSDSPDSSKSISALIPKSPESKTTKSITTSNTPKSITPGLTKSS